MRHLKISAMLIALIFVTFVVVAQQTSPSKVDAAATQKMSNQAKTPDPASPQIKVDSEKNSTKVKIAAPPNKGGAKSRGTGPSPCEIHVDNRTPYIISIYVDVEKSGYERTGQVGRYGDLYGTIGNGSTSVYGRAYFDDGSQKEWGPALVNCPAGGSYTWSLTN